MNKRKQVESVKNNNTIRVEGKYAFHRGDTFITFEEVADRLQAHTQESLVYYWIRDSRLVKYAHTKISRKIDERLQYYSVKFSCIFGGQRFKSKSNGLRRCNRQTRQMECPAFIALRATKCGRKLEVVDVCNDHTHEISEQAVKELPQKRRPSQGLLEEMQELLRLNVEKKMIIDYVKQRENKNILKKDLFNMAMHLRLGSGRSAEDQKVILQRITLSAREAAILDAVFQRLDQFESDNPLNHNTYQESLRSTQNTLDVFDTSTPSAIDFTTLSPELDLLNTTDEAKDQMEYDELACNRVVEVKQLKAEVDSSFTQQNEWTETPPMAVVYKDFICTDDTSYAYGGLELRKKVSIQENVQTSTPPSPVSNESQDLTDKEYFNDLILISPGEGIYPAEESLGRDEPSLSCAEECVSLENAMEDCENAIEEVSIESPQVDAVRFVKKMKRKDLSRYLARKTRRVVVNCRNCGTDARLIRMQISYLKQQRLKLFHETEILRLKKQKLKAELEVIDTSR